MRKNLLFLLLASLLLCLVGCDLTDGFSGGKVKVYTASEEPIVHDEAEVTAVVAGIDLQQNSMDFVSCLDGTNYSLLYHGGVNIVNAHGTAMSIQELSCGMVVDVKYYPDTKKIVDISVNADAVVREQVNKLVFHLDTMKAVYKGTSVPLSEYVSVYDGNRRILPEEINTEDQVTLYIYGNKLVSAAVSIGHGYVRLKNQDSYVGGMVELGYDVIVPVTDDMLLAVREGNYTLRISNRGFSETMDFSVRKDKEVELDLAPIQIPTGTAVFNITPADAKIYVNGDAISSRAFTGYYGTYGVKFEAEGFKTKTGKFDISNATKTFEVNLVALESEDDTTEETTETSTEQTTGTSSGTTTQRTTEGTTGSGTTEKRQTENKITIKTPIGAYIYVDGEYKGITPVSFPKVAGTHTIVLFKTGYLLKSYTITAVDNGKDDEYSYDELTSVIDLLE